MLNTSPVDVPVCAPAREKGPVTRDGFENKSANRPSLETVCFVAFSPHLSCADETITISPSVLPFFFDRERRMWYCGVSRGVCAYHSIPRENDVVDRQEGGMGYTHTHARPSPLWGVQSCCSLLAPRKTWTHPNLTHR